MRSFMSVILFGFAVAATKLATAQAPTDPPSVSLTDLPVAKPASPTGSPPSAPQPVILQPIGPAVDVAAPSPSPLPSGVEPIPGTPEAERAARAKEQVTRVTAEQATAVEPPRKRRWEPAGESPEAALAFMPVDAEAGLIMRGKHLPPRRKPAATPAVVEYATDQPGPVFDLARQLELTRLHLYELAAGGGYENDVQPLADRMHDREVLWGATAIRNIVNTLQIGFSGEAEAYQVIAFREPLDAAFFEQLRPQTLSVSRVGEYEVYRYEPEAVTRQRQREKAGLPPVGWQLNLERDWSNYLVAVAPNVLAIFGSQKDAEAILPLLAGEATFKVRRPTWLTWEADTTFLGFQCYRNRGKEGLAGTPAASDPNARGMLVRWSERTPRDLRFTYVTDLMEPTPKFRTATEKHSIFGMAKLEPHSLGVSGKLVIGRASADEPDCPFTGEHVDLAVYHLCGIVILP